MLLYTDYLSGLYKKFKVVSTYDTDVAYQAWSFCRNLFLSYAENIYRPTAENLIFEFRGSQNVKASKSPFQKFNPKAILSVPHMGNRK